MIKNIVFDLGGVLVDFNPKTLFEHLGIPEEKKELYGKIIFCSREWDKYNCGLFDAKQVKEAIIEKNPEYSEGIKYIFENLDYSHLLFEKTDTAEYLKTLKNEGYNIYLLSDLSKESFEYNASMEFFKDIKGGIYSFEVGSTKPDDNNYERLLKDFNLIPDETIFIDDRLKNIEAANKFGIHVILFTSLGEVKDKVSRLLEG